MDEYDRIPKVELHCHVEGTIRPETVADLARRSGTALPAGDPRDLFHYTSLDDFLRVFWLVQATVRTRDDWTRVAYESIVDAAPHGLRYREAFVTPARHLAAGQRLEDIVEGLGDGLAVAERETGVRCMLIADCDRAFGPGAARELLDGVLELRRAGRADRIIGFGMDSTERGVDLREYADVFAAAKRSGLHRTAHAGEDAGPENVEVAIDVLGAERVDHGLAILEDPALARRMADRRIPLTVCPNSNVLIANRYARLEDHPYRRMREAGLLATLNTDDPAMIDLDIGDEYRTVARAFGFDRTAMGAIALDGIEASWLEDGAKRAMRREFEAALSVG